MERNQCGCDLRGKTFVEENFTGVNFSGGDLRGSRFIRCHSDSGDISCTILFAGADLRGATFHNCTFEGGISWLGANIAGAMFYDCNLYIPVKSTTGGEMASFLGKGGMK